MGQFVYLDSARPRSRSRDFIPKIKREIRRVSIQSKYPKPNRSHGSGSRATLVDGLEATKCKHHATQFTARGAPWWVLLWVLLWQLSARRFRMANNDEEFLDFFEGDV
jgi:hypothetical protein